MQLFVLNAKEIAPSVLPACFCDCLQNEGAAEPPPTRCCNHARLLNMCKHKLHALHEMKLVRVNQMCNFHLYRIVKQKCYKKTYH